MLVIICQKEYICYAITIYSNDYLILLDNNDLKYEFLLNLKETEIYMYSKIAIKKQIILHPRNEGFFEKIMIIKKLLWSNIQKI